jgi:hypothetical protein
MYDADDFCESLNSHNQNLTLDDLVEIRMQISPEKAEELEKGRPMLISQFTVKLGIIETCIEMLKDNSSNEQ